MKHHFEAARERLRANHGVRLVQPHQEGTAAADLPQGTYGFTGSPGLAAPLFAVRRYRNFEIHHWADDIAIVGFVSLVDAARLVNHDDAIEVTIYPDAEGDRTELVAVSYTQITQHRQYAIRNAPGLTLVVRPLAPPPLSDLEPHESGGPQVAP
jgi:hypothetical protein